MEVLLFGRKTVVSKIENVEIKVNRAYESSGNVQFFVRATRTDDQETLLGNNLDYHCFQTKSGLTEDECIDHALFSIIFLMRFFGHKSSDVKFVGFTEENMESVKNYKRFWRFDE